MWWYFYAHSMFHLTKWFPKDNRIKFRILLLLISIVLLVPEFIVLYLPKTSRACNLPLLNLLVASTVFLFFAIGFALLFSVMEPIPRLIKIAFHAFGVGSLILGVLTAVYTFQASSCEYSTPELYYWCYTSAVISLITCGYFALVLPFWILNEAKPLSVLNWRHRTGFCYEPVACCSCVWHI
uniref:Uncharacterized LOC113474186 n=1 Tax=Ciona intestinalis TaxID=7719 RepID=H2XNK2_CIOIN|nr:uncharacterized protein LOC113474186 isoform X1 [Ciona intestinalis]|eukprot:XP_026689924.1 uncharacterized protein LOC113474186 isoform X1 [Ciona intestinalis]